VTEYVELVVGASDITLLVEPVDHKYVPPDDGKPEACTDAVCPLHIVALVAVTVGIAFTTTFPVADEEEQPFKV
jgi:hypothetical protein